MNTTFHFTSIAEIHKALLEGRYEPRELYEYISDNYEEGKIKGSESDYHNLTVEFSRQDCMPFAAAIAKIGSKVYPLSTTLIADAIKYSQESGDIESCKIGFEKLKKIDRKYWDWRTYVFCIDYLKDSLSSMRDIEEYKQNVNDAQLLIEEFKEFIPHEERAYVAQAELLSNQGDYERAMHTLEEGIRLVSVAPQCCMKLADMCLERGEYSKAIETARKGVLAAIQDQPTVSVAYLYYVIALSLDAIRLVDKNAGKQIDDNRVNEIMTAYRIADKLFINEGRMNISYRKTIEARCIILKLEEGVAIEDSIEEQAEKFEKIKNIASMFATEK